MSQNEPTMPDKPETPESKPVMIKLSKGAAGAIRRAMDQLNSLAADQARIEGMVKAAAQVHNAYVQAVIEDAGENPELFAKGYGIWEENGEKYLRPSDPPPAQ